MKRYAFLLLLSSLAFGQGVIVAPQQVLTVVNGITFPVSNATVTVCAASRSGIPCSPALVGVLFKDAALTQPLSNPFTSDAGGNYQFAVASGNYTVTTSAAGFAGYSYQLMVSCVPSSNCTYTGTNTFNSPVALNSGGSLAGTFSGNSNFSGNNTFAGLSQVRIVNGHNDPNWSGSDDGAKINSALSAIAVSGGEVWLAPGTYSISTTVRESVSNVRIKCLGLSAAFNSGGPSCILSWSGSTNGVLALVDSANTSVIVGNGFSGIDFNANSSAGTCLAILSAEYGVYEDDQCNGGFTGSATINAVTYNGGIILGIDSNITNGPGGVNGMAHSWFRGVTSCCGASNANAWLLTGTSTADVFMNTFVTATASATGTGDAWRLENADNNRWLSINGSAVSGFGLHLTCTAAAASQNMCARENLFFNSNLGSGTTALRQDGVSTFYATANRIYGYEVCNGSATPSTTLVTKGSLQIDTQDCGDNVFGTYNFSIGAAGASFLSQINNYKTGYTYLATATQSNPIVMDSASAGVNKLLLINDNAVNKWQVGSGNTTGQEFQIFDSANSQNRFVAGQSGFSSAQIYNTPTGLNHIFRVNNANSVSIDKAAIISSGTAATLAGTGACATRSGQLGGSFAGQVTCTGTTGASTLTITPGDTAPNGFSCWANDITHTLTGSQSTASTTAPVMTFTTVTASDVVNFGCIAY